MTDDMRRETLKGDIRRFLFDRIKDHIGNSMKEAEQRKMAEACDKTAGDLVARAIELVAGEGAPVVRFELSNVTHKQNANGSYIEGKVKAAFTTDAWVACGVATHVMGRLVVPADLYGEAEKISALVTPDQHEMYAEEKAIEHADQDDGPSTEEIAAASEMTDVQKIEATEAIMVIPGPIIKGTQEIAWETLPDDVHRGAKWGWAAAMNGIAERAANTAWETSFGGKPNADVRKGIKLGHQGRSAYEVRRDKGDLPGSQAANADGKMRDQMPEIPAFLRRNNIDLQAEPVEGDAPPAPVTAEADAEEEMALE